MGILRRVWARARHCPLSLSLPGETPVPSVGKHMKCSACGSRKVEARPELHPGGVVAVRERWR